MGVSEDLDKAIELLNSQQPPESYILVCSPEMAAMIEQFEMSNREAVDILKRHLQAVQFPRGNGKYTQTLKLVRAISKGIEALEKGE